MPGASSAPDSAASSSPTARLREQIAQARAELALANSGEQYRDIHEQLVTTLEAAPSDAPAGAFEGWLQAAFDRYLALRHRSSAVIGELRSATSIEDLLAPETNLTA